MKKVFGKIWPVIVATAILYTLVIIIKMIPFIYQRSMDELLEAYFVMSISLFVYGVNSWILKPVGNEFINKFNLNVHRLHSSLILIAALLGWLHFQDYFPFS